MWELLSQPAVQAGLAVAILLVAVSVGYAIIVRLRPSTNNTDSSADELVANFEEMRLEGDIDESELRKIKSVLGKSQAKPAGE